MRKKFMAAVAAGAACLALGAGSAGTASAQVALEQTPAAKTQVSDRGQSSRTQPAATASGVLTALSSAKRCGENFYISGNGVRIRKSPGGTILGQANYWERVSPGQTSGSWTYVNFYNRPAGRITQGWVSSQFVSFHQPTCW